MSFKTIHLFVVFLIVNSLSTTLYAQTQKVLIVPYTRFQFISEFSLEEIASKNNVNADEVFTIYQESLNNAFSSFKSEQFSFVPIDAESYNEIKKYIRYNIDKHNGRKYNASNLTLLPLDSFKETLKKQNATYIMFINWYNISKSVHTVYIGDRNKRAKYSTHLIDYDIYDLEKNRVHGKGNSPLKCGDFPSDSVVSHKSLNASELTICYKSLIDNLVNGLTVVKKK